MFRTRRAGAGNGTYIGEMRLDYRQGWRERRGGLLEVTQRRTHQHSAIGTSQLPMVPGLVDVSWTYLFDLS
jgi:hypothetical protein